MRYGRMKGRIVSVIGDQRRLDERDTNMTLHRQKSIIQYLHLFSFHFVILQIQYIRNLPLAPTKVYCFDLGGNSQGIDSLHPVSAGQ